MSHAATKWAWDQTDITGSEKLVLLRLADHAHPDGTSIRPGMKSLAVYTGISERQIRRYIQGFLDRGLIAYSENEKAGRSKIPTFYIPAVKADADDHLSGSEKRTSVTGEKSQRRTPTTVKADTQDPTIKEEPSGTVNTCGGSEKSNVTRMDAPARSPAQQIMDAFCAATGIEQLANYSKAGGQAKSLLKVGITAEDIPEIVEWMRTQAWLKDGFDLGTVLSQATKWQTSQAMSPKSKLPAGVDLLPGEVAKEIEPGYWEFSRGDMKRYLKPEYYGVIWDPQIHRGTEGAAAFYRARDEARARAEQGQNQEAA